MIIIEWGLGERAGGLLTDTVIGALAVIAPWAGVAAWMFESIFSAIFGSIKTYTSVEHKYSWISNPLDLGDLDEIFSDLMDNEKSAFPKNSLIQNFINKNGAYPDQLSSNNFDFNISNFSAYTQDNTHDTWISTALLPFTGSFKWNLAPNQTRNNYVDLSSIEPHLVLNIETSKSNPDYSSEKKILDDPNIGAKDSALQLAMGSAGDTIPPSDWIKQNISYDLNDGWQEDGWFNTKFIPWCCIQTSNNY